MIEYGDAVVAKGRIMASEARIQPGLCFDVVAVGNIPACGMTVEMIMVFDIDPRSIPGQEMVGGNFVSELVELHGTWQSDGIHVTSFDVVEPEETPLAPCDPPSGGWPGVVGNEEERYWNERRLSDYMGQYSDTIAGSWFARNWTGPADLAHRVVVVGTTRDPQSVTDELRAIYPSNVCAEHVDFSHNELYEVIRAMLEPDPPWNRSIDARRNRVVIQPLMVDQDVIDFVAPYLDRVIVDPAVRLEGPPS
jgi:hypothetical protein